MATIYRKTAKGQTEIETRALKLAPRFRSLLILVDGRRSDDELSRLMSHAGVDGLEALAQGGFIEAIGVTADTGPVSGPRAAPPPPSQAPAVQGFEQRRAEVEHALIKVVGPMAETLALKMERARNAEELKPLLAMAVQLVANTRGRAAAADFAQRFIPD